MPTLITGPLDTLPAAPDPATDSPSTFSTKAAAMVLAIKTMVTQLITIISQINTVTTEVNTNTATASAAAAAAAVSAAATSAVALAAANFKGTWATRTGAATVPYSVSHIGGFWMLLSNLADVTTKTPGTDPEWQRIDRMPSATLVTDLVYQASPGEVIALSNDTAQGAATNLALYSKDLSNAAYTKFATTVSSDATIGPDGQSYADKLTATATTTFHDTQQTMTTPATTITTATVACKAAGRTTLYLLLYDGVSSGITATFDLTTGAHSASAYGSGANADSEMTYLGDDWWDCSVTGRANSVSGSTVIVVIRPHLNASYLGDGVSGVYVDDLQVETGAVATSRILTTSATVTRTAGEVAPQRVVLPLSPSADNAVRIFIANGIDTNVVAANGTGIEDQSGSDVMRLDRPYGKVDLQAVNSKWKVSI